MKKKVVLASFLILISLGLFAQQTNYWLKVCDSTDQCGYADQEGHLKIELGKYPQCFTDTLYNYAIVYKPDAGLVAIDSNEQVLFHVWVVDNGPDYPSEGLFRIVKDGKIGFANMAGEIVIPPQFDAVYPFQDGMAAYCAGCQTKRDELSPEYTYWTGGLWGFIDKKGAVVKEPEYHRKWNNETKKYEFVKGTGTFTVKGGKLIKTR